MRPTFLLGQMAQQLQNRIRTGITSRGLKVATSRLFFFSSFPRVKHIENSTSVFPLQHRLYTKSKSTMAEDNSAPTASSASGDGVKSNDDFYKLNFKTLSGEEYPFEQLRGKVVLIANVASKCGFTPQYKGLEALHKKHADKGLVVLGFPTNQFGHQEPGSSEEIQDFCQKNYGVTFTIMEKSDVNGDKENEVFKYIKTERPGLLGMKRIKWNFEKFLIDRHGNVVGRWASVTAPKDIEKDIEKTLSQD